MEEEEKEEEEEEAEEEKRMCVYLLCRQGVYLDCTHGRVVWVPDVCWCAADAIHTRMSHARIHPSIQPPPPPPLGDPMSDCVACYLVGVGCVVEVWWSLGMVVGKNLIFGRIT